MIKLNNYLFKIIILIKGKCFDKKITTEELYNKVIKKMSISSLDGINGKN